MCDATRRCRSARRSAARAPWAVALIVFLRAVPAFAQPGPEVERMSLEELMGVEVATVSRMPTTRAESPAAVHVITQEDIRRSGVTTLAEALRLAPGVHVARIDATKWAIGIRGFTDRLARSILVLIDGRAVYSPLFAGTYWEVQDYVLEDIDRIEVIRGPGGPLWGANAMNGIINIITKRASETQGTLVHAGVGSLDHGLGSLRYGGRRGHLHYRAYAKLRVRGPAFHPDGRDFDTTRFGQAGFRADYEPEGGNAVTVQGDVYAGRIGERDVITDLSPPANRNVDDKTAVSGGNVLVRWDRALGARSRWRLQAYYDTTGRDEPSFQERRHTGDVDFHVLTRLSRQRVAWGFGYRASAGFTSSVPTLRFEPEDRTDHIFTGFVEDEISLSPDRLRLTLGAKLERNNYSGFELQPSARLSWAVSSRQHAIVSVARAVRTPSRVERDLRLYSLLNPAIPLFVRLDPNGDFEPESQVAYEAGYRVRAAPNLFVTASAFYNMLDDILSTEPRPTEVESTPPPPRAVLPLRFANGLHGNSHGLELTADFRPAAWWRWTGSYSLLRMQLTRDPGSIDVSQEMRGEGLSPRHQVQLQSSLDLPHSIHFDWLFRYVSELPAPPRVPAYATSDVRVAWLAHPHVELALVGQGLHEPHHLEFEGGTAGSVEIPRRALAEVTWQW